MEKKGLWKRLAEFWRSAAPEMGGAPRRLWRNGRSMKKIQERQGAAGGGPLFPEEGERAFSMKRAFAGAEQEERQERRTFPLAAGFRKEGKRLFAEKGTPGQAGRREGQVGSLAEGSGTPRREETTGKLPLWAARTGMADSVPEMARVFFWEGPEEDRQDRKPLPPAGNVARNRTPEEEPADMARKTGKRKTEEESLFRKKEEGWAERKQDAPLDIDGLMREMTRRLWEKREGCGRRLGG